MMSNHDSIWLLGNSCDAHATLAKRLNQAEFRASALTFDAALPFDTPPDILLIFLTGDDCDIVSDIMANPNLSGVQRVFLIHPDDKAARLFCATADIDDIIFRPVGFKELISRLQWLIERCRTDQYNVKNLDELGAILRKKMDDGFSGCLTLSNPSRNALLHFESGNLKTAELGHKTQYHAATAIWRLLPAQCRFACESHVPESLSRSEIHLTLDAWLHACRDNQDAFHTLMASTEGMDARLRINGVIFEKTLISLPKQVRQLLLFFDGEKTLNDILDALNIDERLFARILKRLLDAHILVQIRYVERRQALTLEDWLEADADDIGAGLVAEEAAKKDDIAENAPSPFDQPSQSTLFYLLPQGEKASSEKAAQAESSGSRQTFDTAISSAISGSHSSRDILKQLAEAEKTAPLPEDEAPFSCDGVEAFRTYDRQEVLIHMAGAHSPLVTAVCRMRKNTIYSDAFLEEEARNDREKDSFLLDIVVEDSDEELTPEVTENDIISEKAQDETEGDDADEAEASDDDVADDFFEADGEENDEVKAEKKAPLMSARSYQAQMLVDTRRATAVQQRTQVILGSVIVLALVVMVGMLCADHFNAQEQNPQPVVIETSRSAPEKVARLPKTHPDPQKSLTEPDDASAKVVQLPKAQLDPQKSLTEPDDASAKVARLPKAHPDPQKSLTEPDDASAKVARLPKAQLEPQKSLTEPDDASAKVARLPKTHPEPQKSLTESDDASAKVAKTRKVQEKQREQASATQKEGVSKGAEPPAEQIRALRSAIARRDTSQAEQLSQALLSDYPNHLQVIRLAGDSAALRGDFEKAVEAYKKIESQFRGNVSYWVKRAQYHREMGQTGESDRALQHAIDLSDPQSAAVKKYREMMSNSAVE